MSSAEVGDEVTVVVLAGRELGHWLHERSSTLARHTCCPARLCAQLSPCYISIYRRNCEQVHHVKFRVMTANSFKHNVRKPRENNCGFRRHNAGVNVRNIL